ncbi:hypothetical protein CHRY9390_02944 [Chryseobacterium aquaeductus]|uniref:Uncharacterized protein n=1 Tax=Chryseobacterium aquaeductus TaxID=2675056 RepID=A0A9N8MJD5_9FLAO|nr:hypothetical protein [Chryseobacterium aquaeductus]CAA7332223.1 hypothetical protein CHRY9390_02944 [Chryseobacterium potabilaquae]CAD7815271.1 hypothetical protein CHRY9390_02944 [Chryseobacterium aquaeductus]
MATYESFIKLNGSLGDLVFYNLNGKNVVRRKSGFNKNAFKKNPSYEKVRQNSSEFGHCSKVGKIIRQCLEEYIKESNDALLYQKFAKLMTEIKDLDTISEKGKRTVKNGIATETGFQMLKNFQFGTIDHLQNSASFSHGLWDLNLILDKSIVADEIILETLSIDFEEYKAKHYRQAISAVKSPNEYVIEKYFSEDEVKIHFVALMKDDKIIKMGFV